jgi:inner membrane protein
LLWGLFFFALVLPWIFSLTDREIGARPTPVRGRGWAIFALCGTAILCGLRWAEHAQALAMLNNTQLATEPAKRAAAEPYPIDPFRWHAIVETADFYQTAEINTRTGSIDSDPYQNVLYKPTWTPSIEAAKHTPLGQVYLDWGSWAVVRDAGQQAIPGLDPPRLAPPRTWSAVEFTDLRFDNSFVKARTGGRSPLSGWVYIVDGREEAGEAMDGRVQK